MANSINPEHFIERILELTADIVINAMQTGKLDASNGQAVSTFYKEVAAQICESGCVGLPEITAQYLTNRANS